MTKAELIDQIHGSCDGLTKAETGQAVQVVINQIAGAIASDGSFRYPGFGTFSVRNRAARDGRNPQTGKKIKIAASKTVGFKPAKSLKGSL